MLRRLILAFWLSTLFWIGVADAQNTAVFPGAAVGNSDLTIATNNATTTLNGAVGASDTVITVTSTSTFTVPTIIWMELEAVKCTGKTTFTFTGCTRGFDGTTAMSHLTAIPVSNFVSAWHINQLDAEVIALEAQLLALAGDISCAAGGSLNCTVNKIHGTTVPTNSAADQLLLTTGSAVGAWTSISNCLDSAGNHLNYSTATHTFSCGTSVATAFQVNGVALTSAATINHQNSAATNGLTLGFSNPSAGNIQLTLSGTLNNSGLTNPSTTVNGTTCTLGSTCTPTAAPSGSASGDLSGSYPGPTVAKVNGTSVPTNSAADQVIGTTGSATGSWISLINCLDSGGNHLNYATSTHTFSCGTSASSSPSTTNATGTSGSLPAAGTAGKTYWPTDGFQLYYDTGSTYQLYGPIFPLYDVTAPTYSWVNQGSATVTTTGKGVTLMSPTNGSNSWNMRVMTAPATPYSITIGYIPTSTVTTGSLFVYSGLVLRESSTSKFEDCAVLSIGATLEVVVSKWTTETSFSAHYSGFPAFITNFMGMVWLKVVDTGTNLTCSVSGDGTNFSQIHSVSRTDFMSGGPNQVGFAMDNNNTGQNAYINVLSWKQGTN